MVRRLVRVWRRWPAAGGRRLLRQLGLAGQRGQSLVLVVFSVALGLATLGWGPRVVPVSSQTTVIFIAVLALRLTSLRLVLVAVTGAVVLDAVVLGGQQVRIANFVILAVVAAIAYYTVAGRERLGLVGTRGDSMLAELQDRLSAGALPANVPPGWLLELASRTDGGTAFGGDFVVSRRSEQRLEVALVDVSGKGVAAGSRALQLSGALRGLLGSVPVADFLPQASRFLWEQSWDEGFATAVHLALDLETGEYVLGSAGHPPAALFTAGNGSWRLLEVAGPALGLVPDPAYGLLAGQLGRGDALLLYTDGVVEQPGRDLDVGIDKLLGEANRLVVGGFAGGAGRLLHNVAEHAADDRAVLLLWRRG